jgi:hypothetical protein
VRLQARGYVVVDLRLEHGERAGRVLPGQRVNEDRRVGIVLQRVHEVDPADPEVLHSDAGGQLARSEALGDGNAESIVPVEDVADAGDEDPRRPGRGLQVAERLHLVEPEEEAVPDLARLAERAPGVVLEHDRELHFSLQRRLDALHDGGPARQRDVPDVAAALRAEHHATARTDGHAADRHARRPGPFELVPGVSHGATVRAAPSARQARARRSGPGSHAPGDPSRASRAAPRR